jgi:hypothetical protein
MTLTIELKRGYAERCMLARFIGDTDMPQGEWLPLPFNAHASFGVVANDLNSRFHATEIVLLRDDASHAAIIAHWLT